MNGDDARCSAAAPRPQEPKVELVVGPPPASAGVVVVPLFEEAFRVADLPPSVVEVAGAPGAARRIASTWCEGRWWVLAGLGKRSDLSAEKVRVGAARAHARAAELGASSLHWIAQALEDDLVAALVEGTLLHAYRFGRFRSPASAEDDAGECASGIANLTIAAQPTQAAVVAGSARSARAVNHARDLQNTPANHLTPADFAEEARRVARDCGMEVSVLGPAEIEARGLGGLAAVGRGSSEEPQLIVLRYRVDDRSRPRLGLVGKAITFDSGGLSAKSYESMRLMKYDISGGAVILAALEAIAEEGIEQPVIAVLAAAENMPDGRAFKPGDVVTMANGRTVEIGHTDGEGRMVLADGLHVAKEEGADRLIDVASLTSAVGVALGSAYIGYMSNDDEWAGAIAGAAADAGEPLWRLPLHSMYDDLIKSSVADFDSAPLVTAHVAGAVAPAQLLSHFVGETPWAHVDIGATSWDTGRAYAGEGGSGVFVRTMIHLARSMGR